MFGRSTAFNWLADRDRVCNELKRRLHLARCARNKTDERRITKELKRRGVSV